MVARDPTLDTLNRTSSLGGPWVLGAACTRAHAPAAHPWLMEPGPAQYKHSTTVTFNVTSASKVWFMIGPDQFLRISHGFSCLLARYHARGPTRNKPDELTTRMTWEPMKCPARDSTLDTLNHTSKTAKSRAFAHRAASRDTHLAR